MIMKDDAMTATMFYHVRLRNADGTALRCRANGRCKTWKTRPDDFQVPVKYGLKQCFYLNPRNAADWLTYDPTEAKREVKEKEKNKLELCNRFALAWDTPDCIVRDRMLDANISESQWPVWLLAVK